MTEWAEEHSAEAGRLLLDDWPPGGRLLGRLNARTPRAAGEKKAFAPRLASPTSPSFLLLPPLAAHRPLSTTRVSTYRDSPYHLTAPPKPRDEPIRRAAQPASSAPPPRLSSPPLPLLIHLPLSAVRQQSTVFAVLRLTACVPLLGLPASRSVDVVLLECPPARLPRHLVSADGARRQKARRYEPASACSRRAASQPSAEALWGPESRLLCLSSSLLLVGLSLPLQKASKPAGPVDGTLTSRRRCRCRSARPSSLLLSTLARTSALLPHLFLSSNVFFVVALFLLSCPDSFATRTTAKYTPSPASRTPALDQ